MNSWITDLKLLTEAEYHSRRVVATLATVGGDGTARGRMVIVRQIDDGSGEIWMTTDGRSEKAAELAVNPSGELVFWAPQERVQFRVRGRVEIVSNGPAREHLWGGLSEASRAMFDWPAPGTPRHHGHAYSKTFPASRPIPEAFVALVMRPESAEALELNETPHRRRLWAASAQWQVELINP